MLKNYFKIAWRNIWRQKLYAFVNIAGLAAGLAACMLILSYLAHEKSYDRFHRQADRIFSTYVRETFGADTIQVPSLSFISAPELKASNGSVKSYVRFNRERKSVSVKNSSRPSIKFSQENILYADSNFFTFFTFPLLKGKPEGVLDAPGKVVLSESTAQKYFGPADPVGKTLIYDGKHPLKVAGVAQDAPSNSTIRFDMVVSMATIKSWEEKAVLFGSQKVGSGNFTTYFLLNGNASVRSAEQTLGRLAVQSGSEGERFVLTPMPRVHFDANFGDYSQVKYLKIFGGVAVLILLLALVNYMSLATAKATFRAKEVGIRKVLGAARRRIAGQFYIESTFFVLVAFAFGLVLFGLLRPYFYRMLQLEIDGSFVFSSFNLMFLTGLLILSVLGAGAYPALFLSSFRPAVLYGKFSRHGTGASIRRFFIVFQFVIAVGLISGGIIIQRQLSYFRNVDTGISRKNVLMIPFAPSLGKHYPAFKKELASLAGVQEIAAAKYSLYGGYDMFSVNAREQDQDFTLKIMNIDRNLLGLLDVSWKIPPRDPARVLNGDGFIINEAAVSKLNLPANPVGEMIELGGETYSQVAGVVQDFNFESLHGNVDALALFVTPDTSAFWAQMGGCVFIKIVPEANLKPLITAVDKLYSIYDKKEPFEYHFLDDTFDALYKAEDRLAQVFGFFILLAVLIACFGLFGLAAFTAEQRTKEIGIRKVLGASVSSVAALLSKDFIKLVLIAVIVASPFAWYFMNKWLENFAYRIELEWWIFVLVGLLAVIIAMLTVSFQSVKAALMNPVNSLRSE